MSEFDLNSPFTPYGDQPSAIKAIHKNFVDGKQRQTLLGVTGSGKTFSVANVIKKLGKKTLILAPNKTLAAQLYEEFKEFFPNNAVEFFVSYYDYYQPEAYVVGSDVYIEKDSSINDEIDKLRHSATRSLMERDDVIVVASVSCIYGIGSPDEYKQQRIKLFIGDEVNRDEFLRNLVAIQFNRNDYDFSRGCFRVRGDLIEIFPAHEDSEVIRIELFGDEVEGIYMIDPLRGKVLQSLNKITIYPKSHYVVGEERLKKALKEIKSELRGRLQYFQKEDKLVEKQRLEQRTLLDIEMLEEMGFCSGIENYSRHFTDALPGEPPPTLVDFFDKDFLLVVDESHITIPQVRAMYKGDRSRKMNLVEYGFRLPCALDNRPLNFEEFDSKLDDVLYVSATPADYELEQSEGEVIEQVIRPTGLLDPIIEVRNAETQVDDLYVEARETIKQGFRVLVTTLTKKLAEELTNYFKGLGIKVRYLHSDIDTIERVEILKFLREGEIDVLVGINLLREGLDLPEVALVAILDADKEGFLRSTRSLIQTIGRAARNSEGRVILYAYQTTKSMKQAMTETSRRREKQISFNEENNIQPKTISKSIKGGIIETLRGVQGKKSKVEKRDVELSLDDIEARIKELKSNMKELAKELRFEEAAKIRDEIKQLTDLRLQL